MKKKASECQQTIKDVIEVLEKEVAGYSTEFMPERIGRLNAYIKHLKNGLTSS